MYDADIRQLLRAGLKERVGDNGVIVDELGIDGGSVRADLAVIMPDRLIGYEIKSNKDSTARLLRQTGYYDMVFDENYVVCGPKQYHHVKKIVPEWWGIYTVYETGLGPEFRLRRSPQINYAVDPAMLARMLWRDEVIAALMMKNIKTRVRSRYKLWALLIEAYDHDELRRLLRDSFMQRQGWRDQL